MTMLRRNLVAHASHKAGVSHSDVHGHDWLIPTRAENRAHVWSVVAGHCVRYAVRSTRCRGPSIDSKVSEARKVTERCRGVVDGGECRSGHGAVRLKRCGEQGNQERAPTDAPVVADAGSGPRNNGANCSSVGRGSATGAHVDWIGGGRQDALERSVGFVEDFNVGLNHDADGVRVQAHESDPIGVYLVHGQLGIGENGRGAPKIAEVMHRIAGRACEASPTTGHAKDFCHALKLELVNRYVAHFVARHAYRNWYRGECDDYHGVVSESLVFVPAEFAWRILVLTGRLWFDQANGYLSTPAPDYSPLGSTQVARGSLFNSSVLVT